MLVLVAALGLLVVLVQGWEPLAAADRHLSRALEAVARNHPGLVVVMQAVSDLGQPLTWWILHPALTVYFLVRRQAREALFVVGTAGGGGLLNRAMKSLVGRPRPEWSEPVAQASGFAFPSGHTTGTAIGVSVLLILLVPVLSTRWRWVAVILGSVLVLAVGVSRVMLGVHWASDVLGSGLLSAAWVVAMVATFRPRSIALGRGRCAAR